jgi:DNA polymerase-3 subunit gamma/tau
MPAISAAEEAVQEILPEKDLPSGEKLAAISETALDAIKKICEAVNLDSIPIALLRKAAAWSHVGASGAAKVIIIENADKMLDSARNSLLKILEEPPPHLTFILTTPRRAAILPTILSRVRTYRFIPRDEQAGRQVLGKIFREESSEFTNLRDFFRAFQGVDPLALRKAARDFLEKARSRSAAFPAGDESWFTDKTKFRVFLQELADTMERALRGGEPELPVEKLEEWTALMRKTLESLSVNIAPALLAQRIYTAIGRP